MIQLDNNKIEYNQCNKITDNLYSYISKNIIRAINVFKENFIHIILITFLISFYNSLPFGIYYTSCFILINRVILTKKIILKDFLISFKKFFEFLKISIFVNLPFIIWMPFVYISIFSYRNIFKISYIHSIISSLPFPMFIILILCVLLHLYLKIITFFTPYLIFYGNFSFKESISISYNIVRNNFKLFLFCLIFMQIMIFFSYFLGFGVFFIFSVVITSIYNLFLYYIIKDLIFKN